MTTDSSRDLRVPSPSLAAFLSFLLPGLGQWYAGRRRVALLFAIPVIVAVLVTGFSVRWDVTVLVARLFSPRFALAALAVVALAGLLRLLSIVDAVMSAREAAAYIPGARPRRSGRPVALLLGVIALAAHVAVGNVIWSFYQAGSTIFVAQPGGPENPAPGAPPSPEPGSTPAGSGATPSPTPFPVPDSRLTVLFTGVDSGPGRTHALTDTLLVASIDPATNDVTLVSFPRDLARFPLADGSRYDNRINTFLQYAANDPERYPEGAMPALAQELGHLLGIRIDYYARIELSGFEQMIDLVGGVDIDNPRTIDDPFYGVDGFYLPAGPQHLDGATALKYVRSRRGAGDNDFTRARRQQQVLLAVRGRMSDPAVLGRLPELLAAASQTIKTNYPAENVTALLGLAQLPADDDVDSYVLGPRKYAERPPPEETGGAYLLTLKLDAVAELSVQLFGHESRYYQTGTPGYLPDEVPGQPAGQRP